MGLGLVFKAAAETLAGHLANGPTRIVWRRPCDPRYAKGMYYRDDGVGVIEIDPELPEWEAFKVYLHECAHLRMGHGRRGVNRAKTLQDREIEAGAYAEWWEDWSETWCPDGNWIDKLETLARWRPGEAIPRGY